MRSRNQEKGPIQLAWMVNKIRVRYAPKICFTIQASWMGSKGSGRSSV